jgi:hypothetical protein
MFFLAWTFCFLLALCLASYLLVETAYLSARLWRWFSSWRASRSLSRRYRRYRRESMPLSVRVAGEPWRSLGRLRFSVARARSLNEPPSGKESEA